MCGIGYREIAITDKGKVKDIIDYLLENNYRYFLYDVTTICVEDSKIPYVESFLINTNIEYLFWKI